MESWTTMLGDEVTATQLLPLFENAREKKEKKALFGQKYFWAATKEERMKVHAKKRIEQKYYLIHFSSIWRFFLTIFIWIQWW